jgi:hypothetical protein
VKLEASKFRVTVADKVAVALGPQVKTAVDCGSTGADVHPPTRSKVFPPKYGVAKTPLPAKVMYQVASLPAVPPFKLKEVGVD